MSFAFSDHLFGRRLFVLVIGIFAIAVRVGVILGELARGLELGEGDVGVFDGNDGFKDRRWIL